MATISGGDKLEAALKAIAEKLEGANGVRVGFLEGGRYEDGTSIAAVAFWNEYGTSRAPPRPFFRTAIDNQSSEWASILGRAAKHYNYDSAQVMAAMGTKMAEDIQQSIVGWQDPANAESTVKKKGFNKPLIDTGTMQRSVDFEVINNGS